MKQTFTALLLLIIGSVTSPIFADDIPSLDKAHTAVLITDPQNDFLHPKGKLYKLLEANMKQLNTIDNIERLMKASKKSGVTLAVDPLMYTPLDSNWTNAGTLQRQLLDMKALHTKGYSDKELAGSGADYFERYKPFINDGKTIKVAPHKMYGPESNDLVYQLRSRGIDTVILGGLVANLCVDSHMRALMENGFRVYVVKDAVAAPGEDAYNAALTNYGMIANGVLTTDQAVAAIGG
jgi:nicotinamidase-related amidase